MVFLMLLIVIILVIILIDLIPLFTDWIGRIHIGRYYDMEHWNYAITSKAVKWVNHTPKIKVTDNTRLMVIDRIKGNYTKKTVQYWQEAALLLGLIESLKSNDSEKLKVEIKTFLERNFNKEGQWKKKPLHIDGAILAYSVMKLDFINKDLYKPAYDYIWNLIKEHIGDDGTVQYRKAMKIYRYVDTIGFICPFLIAYGLRYQKEECIELAYKQIMEFKNNGLLNGCYLPCHAYDVRQKIPFGLYGWGRGLGWFAIGLIDTWKELPNSHKYSKGLEELVVDFATTLRKFQHENGSWNWTVTRNESRSDSSATATLGWFLLNASELKDNQIENLAATERAFNYLMKVTRRDGGIDFSQGDTKDIGVYSSLFNIMPFTQGFATRCSSLYLRKKETAKDVLMSVS